MGRAAIMINAKTLQSLIDTVESNNTFANYTDLCKAVSDADINMDCCRVGNRAKKIHHGQVYLAIKNKLVTIKTVKGKRGGKGGTVNRTSRADKFAANPEISKFFTQLDKDAPEKYKPLVEKAKNGNRDALVRLKCIQCYGYTKLHKSCNADGTTQPPCGLYPLNLMFWPNRVESSDDIYNPLNRK